LKTTIDPDRCVGHGICAMICPDVFAIGDDGFGTVLDAVSNASFRPLVDEAAENCPEGAISVTAE
jgi:ferredoxin